MSARAQMPLKPAAAPARSLSPAPFGVLQRKCACGGSGGSGGECAECKKKRTLQRRAASDTLPDLAPPIVHEVLRSPGQPLDAATRAYMEPRFGHDFSRVRVHADGKAAASARAVDALAYTVGQNVVFAAGRHEPATPVGRKLLAHELTHVVQQQGTPESASLRVGNAGDPGEREAEAVASGLTGAGGSTPVQKAPALIQRQATEGDPAFAADPVENAPAESQQNSDPASGAQTPGGAGTSTEKPEKCPPPSDMACPSDMGPATGVTNTISFLVNSARLSRSDKVQIDAAAASWNSRGAPGKVRVDGYASADYECVYNWQLSCRRAQAVAAELEHPSDGSKGVPAASISLFAHGESDAAGTALAPNRRVTISIPAGPPAPSPSPAPGPSPAPSPTPTTGCTLPISLGVGRTGCGTGTDFTHYDFPSISTASAAKLAAWAALYTPGHLPLRSLVSDAQCELEMDGVLFGLAGAAGHTAFTRFRAGTGGTETHGAGSTLGTAALASGSFARTLATVKSDIESQLASQAASGALNACALSVTPPATHFDFSDGLPLKSVIGGTHGESLDATAFTGDIPTRTYSISLEFLICDNFGVDEHDLYAPGLFAFWVLQHERSATLYAPFINLLDLPVTVSGRF